MSDPGEQANKREETPASQQAEAMTKSTTSKVPASLASKTREELAELLLSTLKQLKSRDQRLNELSKAAAAERDLRDAKDKELQEQAIAQDEKRARVAAELAALQSKHEALEKEHAELVREQAEADIKQQKQSKQQDTSADELAALRKTQAKLKKAVAELRKRNEALDAQHREALASNEQVVTERDAAIKQLKTAQTQIATQLQDIERSGKALADYKQKAHALLKTKDDEIKNGSTAIRNILEKEVETEKAARKEAEVERDAAVEELAKAQSQVAAQLHDVELHYKDRLTQLQKELDLQASHAKNSTKRLQQLQVRYESAQQRYESLKNSTTHGGENHLTEREGHSIANGVSDQRDAATTAQKLEEAMHALDKANAEVSAAKQINNVLEQEVSSLKATVKQLRMTLAMKDSIKMPFKDHIADLPASPFSPAEEQANSSAGLTGTSALLQEKLSVAERKASVAEREIDELELEIRLRETQERALKDTIRELEGEIHRLKLASSNNGVDIEYLKNCLIQVFKGAQDECSLLQVVAKILSLTPEEVEQCMKAIKARRSEAEAGYLPDLSSFMPTSFLR